MGCTSSTDLDPYAHSRPPPVDPKLPFHSFRQVFTVRNTWKAVQRKLEETARICLISFLEQQPQYQAMYPELEGVASWSEEKQEENLALRNASLQLFNVLDEVMATLESVNNRAADTAITLAYQEGIRMGKEDPHVDHHYYKHMEKPLMGSIHQVLGDRFTENQEFNMRLFYEFMCRYLTLGLEKSLRDSGRLQDNNSDSGTLQDNDTYENYDSTNQTDKITDTGKENKQAIDTNDNERKSSVHEMKNSDDDKNS